MLTNLVEGGKVKCLQYWPDSDSKNYGPFEVTITDKQMFADYLIRVFTVKVSTVAKWALQDMELMFCFVRCIPYTCMVRTLSDVQLTPHAYTAVWQYRSSSESDTVPLHCMAWPWNTRLCDSNPSLPQEGEIPAWLRKRTSSGPLQVQTFINCNSDKCQVIRYQCTCQAMMMLKVPMHNKLY